MILCGQYGHGYGSDEHQFKLTAVFTGTEQGLVLSVTGYDIDLTDEVAVYLNDTAIGYLSPGSDNGFNEGDFFFIPAALQLTGRI